MKLLIISALYLCVACSLTFAQSYKIIESSSDNIKIEFNFENKYRIRDTLIEGNKFQYIEGDEYFFGNPGDPYIPGVLLNIGIPFNSNPPVKVLSIDQEKIQQVFLIPYPDSLGQPFNKLNFNDTIYNSNNYFPGSPAYIKSTASFRYARVAGVMVYPFQFNPITRELILNKKITLMIDYSIDKVSSRSIVKISDQLTDDMLKLNVINPKEAISFTGKVISAATSSVSSEPYWYDPQKNYYKIYLNKKGVYRITHDYLSGAGIPVTGLSLNKLELINIGENIPIDVVDSDSNNIFTSGDYFQFIGYPPSPTPYNTSNIYNLSNVYWFSYQSTSEPVRYKNKNGFPAVWTNSYQSNLATIHYEEDKFSEKLGYANDDKRDFWFWGKASARSGNSTQSFTGTFQTFQNYILDSNRVTLRVNMHGMTTTSSFQCLNNHKAYISITGQPIGTAIWSNQNTHTFIKSFYVSQDSINIYPTGNTLNVSVKGDACPITDSDEIRINWFEFEYWKENRTNENNFSFQCASPYVGINRFWLYGWQRNNMKIYIPQRGEIISNPQIVNDEYNSVLFVDTLSEKTEYFCAGDDYFILPDSIVADQSSDLRNTGNGADYIIITHPKFISAAQKLSDFRSSNLTGFTAPRTKIIDVNEIFDEFSFGLLEPNSLQKFVKYAFENWQSPSPSYIVIIGDMSSDYRKIMSTSRSNFVPSILYFSRTFGHVPSDNLIVDVVGNDLYPDLAVGRLSCETVEEANTLVDKIINYPADNSKAWKENILFLASGLSESDQILFGFNDSSKALERDLLLPKGFTTAKVFNYPDPKIPGDLIYKGSGPKMREELNKGAAVVNYYGHGGGGQWDLIFTNDDILELNNGNKLPIVLSVTCYTAQFDNQDCFGEIFVKTPNKGAIGFLGSTGLTYWGPGTIMNRRIYEQIFSNKNYVIGKAILNAKSHVGGFIDMIAQLTYFGDPALELALPKYPDFEVQSSDISIIPESPLKNDTVSIKINIRNVGIIFSDSVTVEVYKNSTDISNLVGTKKLGGFGQNGSALIKWIPGDAGLYNLIIRINETDPITEVDHSDNTASASFAIYDLNEPGVIRPIDGFSSSTNKIEFLLADISENVGKNLFYFIEIDTSLHFLNPLIKTQGIGPENGLVKWFSPASLSNGVFFWRVRISDGENFSNWSKVRSFSIIENPKDGYLAFDNILKTFESNNISYSESDKSLQLNLSLLPPRPSNETFIEDIIPNTNITDSVGLTTITTDGTYLYFGNIWYYAQYYNSGGRSFIYKIGTGNNGTVKGGYYGTIPNFYDKIAFQIFYHSDGFLYAAVGDPYQLKKINPINGDTSSVFIPQGILDGQTGKPTLGSFYITSDGNYVYNLALVDSLGAQRYLLRTFNSSDNWNLLRPDIQLTSTSYYGFTGFFAAEGYVYPHENYFSGFMRRIRVDDGFFEEEWITFKPFKSYYAWCWDWQNNHVYASVYRSNNLPKISKFEGKYLDAHGSTISSEIGPALKWNQVSYEMESNGSAGSYNGMLLGLNKNTNLWDTLNANLPSSYSLVDLNASIYNKLKLRFDLRDTTFGVSLPLKFKSVNVSYLTLPEIVLTRKNLTFQPDSILQGFPIYMELKVMNVGDENADSIKIEFYLNDSDSVLHRTNIKVPADTSNKVEYIIQTDQLSPHASHKIKAIASLQSSDEYYVYNNIIDNSFFVVRDSIKPIFTVTIDGKEIVNGDVVSAKPEILITLKDDSPLPLDTSLFTIIYNNIPLSFSRADVQYTYTPYPNSESKIRWTPDLPDGKHTLEALAKDASGNFFDTTSLRTVFYVYNQPNLLYVYNYPNPFKNDTYFTFELRGTVVPDEFLIKIYTVAGRLIKDITVPSSSLNIGFNRIYWDGRDEDGDEISNGIYFYKVISRLNDETKIITQKLAKVK